MLPRILLDSPDPYLARLATQTLPRHTNLSPANSRHLTSTPNSAPLQTDCLGFPSLISTDAHSRSRRRVAPVPIDPPNAFVHLSLDTSGPHHHLLVHPHHFLPFHLFHAVPVDLHGRITTSLCIYKQRQQIQQTPSVRPRIIAQNGDYLCCSSTAKHSFSQSLWPANIPPELYATIK